ncbi:MAG: hypothetical protein FWF40_00635 [Methanomassiliicoccaceae archaeon]|nr:hypothetical protein [Methanomassiliicoccaceae archaeon]
MLSAVCSVVGMLLVAVLALLLAVSYLNDAWGFTTIATKDFNVVLAAVSVIMGGVGIFSLKSGDLTEGILFCSIGMLFLVTSASAILGLGMVAYFGWIVMIVVLMVIAILLASHDISFGLAAALFAIGYMFALAFSSSDVLNMVAGLAYLVAGVLFFYIAVSDWVYVETGEDLPLL